MSVYGTRPIRLYSALIYAAGIVNLLCLVPDAATARTAGSQRIDVDRIEPGPRGGFAYRLEYEVAVPIDVFWRFKTDFESTDISDSRHIERHRLIKRNGNEVLTENQFSSLPGATFIWKTKVDNRTYRLDFRLLRTDFPGHRFHYGYIQLQSRGAATLVTQVAYFDFVGATLWTANPWTGGMKSFLTSVACWEQEKIQQLRYRYNDFGRPTAFAATPNR